MILNWLIIDPQMDFCPGGELGVPGSGDDMRNIAMAMHRTMKITEKIHVTLDCHDIYDIGHPTFWSLKDRGHPQPFVDIPDPTTGVSTVTPVLFESREVTLSIKEDEESYYMYEWVQHYLDSLEEGGRYRCAIWPEHCLIGSHGAQVNKDILHWIHEWEESHHKPANFIMKGMNPRTEHYSALKAEVQDPLDPSTRLNTDLIDELDQPHITVLVGGIAGSHCVRFTVEDLVDNLEVNEPKNIILLEDAMSPVPGCEGLQSEFFHRMKSRGVQVARTTDF